jgi:DNA-binding protein H-NS
MAKTTYEKLQRQIAALQAQAEKLRRKELDEVIARIREAIVFYGITAEDLGLAGAQQAGSGGSRRRAAVARPAGTGKRKRKRAATAAAASKATANGAKAGKPVVRYRDENNHTWAGRGKRPQWLRDALAAGRALDEFRVGPA